jgi:hypothetical protein
VYFSKDVYGCQNCFGCVNLRNKSYYIFNEPYTKESYFEELKKYDLSSHAVVDGIKQKVEALRRPAPVRYMHGVHNKDVSGDHMINSKNVFDSFYMVGAEDCRYCQFCSFAPTRDCYDMTLWGQNATRIYECMGAGDSEDMVKFCFDAWAPATNVEYSYHIVAPNKNIFGCVGLKNKEYCILNKQYTKEEYEELVGKIKKHMDEMPYVDERGIVYKYGEFFPSEISLFAYNETLAQSYFPLERTVAIEKGFRWKEREETVHATTKDVVECEVSKRAFRLTPAELQFYAEMNIPLPRLHPDERHKRRLAKQNPMRLWHRKCMNEGCENEFETSYSPERVEVVYCERCYQREVT